MAGLLIDEALGLFDKLSAKYPTRDVTLERRGKDSYRPFRVAMTGGAFYHSDFEWIKELCDTTVSAHDDNGFYYVAREMSVRDPRGTWQLPALQVQILKR